MPCHAMMGAPHPATNLHLLRYTFSPLTQLLTQHSLSTHSLGWAHVFYMYACRHAIRMDRVSMHALRLYWAMDMPAALSVRDVMAAHQRAGPLINQ